MSTFNRSRDRSSLTQQTYPTPVNNGSVQESPVWAWVPAPPSSWRYAVVGWQASAPTLEDLPKLQNFEQISDWDGGDRQAIKPVSHTKTLCPPYPLLRFALRNQITTESMDGSSNPPRLYHPYYLNSHRVHNELLGYFHDIGFLNLGTQQWVPPAQLTPPSRKGELPAQIVKRIEDLGVCQQAYEMKDMPELAGMFRTRGSIGELARSIGTMLSAQRLSKRNTKWFLEALRKSYLGKVFGIDPTVSLVRDIARLCKNGPKERKRTFTVTLRGSKKESLCRATGLTALNVAYSDAVGSQLSVVSRVDGARVTDVRPYVGQHSETMQRYIDALVGVNGARLFWDVAPFGFVADWFLSIDDVLDTLWANSTHSFKIEYWSSTCAEITQTFEGTYVSDVSGYWPDPVFTYASLPSYEQSQRIYNRQLEEQPSPLSSLRCRIGPKTAFLTLLLALGYVPKR